MSTTSLYTGHGAVSFPSKQALFAVSGLVNFFFDCNYCMGLTGLGGLDAIIPRRSARIGGFIAVRVHHYLHAGDMLIESCHSILYSELEYWFLRPAA